LPDEFQTRFKDPSKGIKPFARVFCFYGVGDSAGQWMRDFVRTGAVWCEMVVYECRGHGTRGEEPFDATKEETADDAWEAMRAAFEQQVPGGPAEGCPFVFFCHSAGSVTACMVAARLRSELGLEPTGVFIIDQRTPMCPFLSDHGYEVMCRGVGPLESSWEWMQIWNPQVCPMKGKNELGDEIYARWSYGMRILEDFYRGCTEQFHTFNCPLYVFVGLPIFYEQTMYESGEMSPEQKAKREPWYRVAHRYDRADFEKWKEWTTSSCELIGVQAGHFEIWYHPDTQVKFWQEFLKLSGFHKEWM